MSPVRHEPPLMAPLPHPHQEAPKEASKDAPEDAPEDASFRVASMIGARPLCDPPPVSFFPASFA